MYASVYIAKSTARSVTRKPFKKKITICYIFYHALYTKIYKS